MRVLITGVSGAMGYYLAQYIKGIEPESFIVGIGRKFSAPDVAEYLDKYEQLDLYWQPESRIREVISEAKPDVIYHLAALANVRDSFQHPRRFAYNNTEGTLGLFQAIADTGLKPKIVLASTSEVYGNVPAILNPIPENLPFKPVNPYAVTKCCQENYANYYATAYGLPLVITRAFGYINPKREDLVATAIARQLVSCERGNRNEVYHGDLSPTRSFCDVRDIARAYYLAGVCPPGIYNIGSEEATTVKQLVSTLASISTAKPEWREQVSLTRLTDVFYAVPDVIKFRRVTLWRPEIKLHESLIWLMEETRKCAFS
jgi:nucleoside-diphosphate-sugar epimerase